MTLAVLLASPALAQPVFTASDADMKVVADLRESQRKIMRSTITLPAVDSGELVLWYPLFIPGNHAPSGPIQNIGEFRVADAQGRAIEWERDASEPARIVVQVPRESAGDLTIETAYLASQPWHMSRSSDSYGFDTFGAVNWNTLLWYPEDADLREFEVDVEVLLPDGYTHAWALGPTEVQDVPFMKLIDSPIIFSRHLNTYELPAPEEGYPPHFIHLASEESGDALLPDWMLGPLGELTRQGRLVFGDFPRQEFHFLTMVDSSLSFGLEHAESTFISARTRAFSDADRPDDFDAGMGHLGVIPHEYIHAWCGKLAAPVGLVRENYHDPVDSSLLWVYEGLTSYYDDVLSARAGMISPEQYREIVRRAIERYENQPGRAWRPVVDTARDVVSVRRSSPAGNELRRGADYYGEAALFWMEADAIIRRETNGRRSLDDFCKAFFDVRVQPVGDQATYTRDDVVRTLRRIHAGTDWDALIRSRIERPVEDLSMQYLVDLLGQTRSFSAEPNELQRRAERSASGVNLRYAAGFAAGEDGVVSRVVEDSDAEHAGLKAGDRIMAVGEVVFSREAILDAVRATTDHPDDLELLVARGERLVRLEVPCDGSRRFMELAPKAGEPDLISAISAPRTR
ncbi:MAG: PDZ domain-containing protein [Phycisphaerales bacterium JB065]